MIINCHKIEPYANLAWANLARANLTDANLNGANLTDANLTDANLTWASLTEANLTRANLTNAKLIDANLTWANLTNANLTGTCLDPEAPVPYLTDEEILRAGLEIDGDLVYGWRTKISIHCGRTMYEPDKCYTAPWFSVCQERSCHPGIYLAGKEWLVHEYGGYSRVRCYCRRDELIHARDKWRCKRLWVVAS